MAKKRTQKKSRKKSRKKRSHNRGFFKIFVISIIFALAAIFIYERYFYSETNRSGHSREVRKSVKLFVADGEGLKGINRSVKTGPLKSEIKETFKILLWADSGIIIPEGTRLLKVKIKGGTAYLDINSAIRDNHPGGTSAEMQTIYSIVNSITLNFPKIREVKILIEGKTEKTLAGHIDISEALGPYRALITDS
ncbi:MAG: GerMN domain-containing protein [Thermodesulfobacteriota bacterium]